MVKFIAWLLSIIFCLNHTLSLAAPPRPPVAFRLAFEEKIKGGMAVWNRVESYEKLVAELPITANEKKRFKSLLKAQGLSKLKPVAAEFIPQQRKFVLHFPTGDESIVLLSIAPTVVAFNGTSIIEVRPKSSFLEVVEPKTESSRKSSVKGAQLLWLLAVPEAQAQIYTNEQIMAMEKQNQQVAQQQTSLAKNILLAAGLAFGGFLIGAWLWGHYAHHLNPDWGLEAKGREREAAQELTRNKAMLRDKYPELQQILFNDKVKLRYFECAVGREEKASTPSPVAKASFVEADGTTTKEFDFKSNPSEIQKIIADTKNDYSQRIEKVEFCCQTPPCSQWLAEQTIANQSVLPTPPAPAESGTITIQPSSSDSPPPSGEPTPGNK